jgi:hypothetical protein
VCPWLRRTFLAAVLNFFLFSPFLKTGKKWTLGEVTRFLELFHEHGSMWNHVAEGIAGRTPLQCEALFLCNKSLIAGNVQASILHTVLMDRYESSPALANGAQKTARRGANSSGGGSVPRSAPAPSADLANRPKRKLEFGSSNNSGGSGGGGAASESHHNGDNALPFKKRMGGDGSSNASSPVPTQRVISRVKQHQGGGGGGSSSEQSSSAVTHRVQQAPDEMQQQLGRLLGGEGRLFCMYEWFYSHLDRDYFALNEFASMLAMKANFPLGNVPLLTRSEWGAVRRKLGRPRRLSAAFLRSEREKLHAYREDVRSVRAGNPVLHPEAHGLDFFSVKDRLPVGCQVVVWRWATRTVATGLVVKVAPSRYEVQCEDADREWYSDLDVAAHVSEESTLRIVADHHDVCQGLSPLHPNLGVASPMPAAAKAPRHYSGEELAQVALLARINRMKAIVLQALHAFHDHAERASSEGTPLLPAFKRAHSTLMMMLRHCNQLRAPLARDARDAPAWPVGGAGNGVGGVGGSNGLGVAPRDLLRELPSAWLRKMSARCEQDANNTLDIAGKAVAQKRPDLVLDEDSRRLIHNSVTLVHYVQHVASMHELYLSSEISVALDMALTRIRPVHSENQEAFARVEKLVRDISTFVSDPDRKE